VCVCVYRRVVDINGDLVCAHITRVCVCVFVLGRPKTGVKLERVGRRLRARVYIHKYMYI